MKQKIGIVQQIRIGQPQLFARGQNSSINRQPIDGKIAVTPMGLVGDAVADMRFHGGEDKAVHCYSLAHYLYWRERFGAREFFQAGGFGENFCVDGVDEMQICIGDIWQIGTAQFAISQGRQPCWKLNERFSMADMALQVQQSLRCGWYLRVLQTGEVASGDAIFLLERPFADWSVARICELIANKICDAHAMREVLDLPLSASWRKLFEMRLQTGQCEDWSRRLFGASFQAA